MTAIALTGGIGSGKSTVFALLKKRGYAALDADVLAREAVALPDVRQSVIAALGAACYAPDGAFDRASVRSLVFKDPGARAVLESITHPAIARLFSQKKELLARVSPAAWLFYEASLIFEAGRAAEFDAVVVVTAPRMLRLERLERTRGLAPADAEAIMDAQWPDAAKAAHADFVIDNAGGPDELNDRVSALVAFLGERFFPATP